jgi:hypothetical protein
MTTVSLEGLQSGAPGEDRAIAILKVEHNGQSYDWQRYVHAGVDLATFINGLADSVGAEIDVKEAEWAALTPKTREIPDPMAGEIRTVEIGKSEVVCPEIPDYYARRRAEYPAVGDQLGAQWKGGTAASAMQAKIQAVKDKYPKPVWL